MKHSDPFIAKLSSLVALDQEDMDAALQLPRKTTRVERRGPVLAQNAEPDYVYVLLTGWAARYELRDDGSRRITGFLLPGDFCGIHAVCHARMDHSIVAITDCELAHIPVDAIGAAAHDRPALNMAIWRAKLIEEAILRKWLLFSTDAQRSVAHLLCELYVRAAIIGQAVDGRCSVPLTQEEIGDALSITGIHINRVISRLRSQGILELSHRELVILDRKAMAQAARFDHSYLEPWLSENAVSLLS